MPRSKWSNREDDEPFIIPTGELYRIACCDCGLVHDFVFLTEKKGDTIIAKARRNMRSTAQRRRYLKP